MNSFSIIFFQPPFDNITMPLLGAPLLKGYLKSKGFENIKCVDINVEFFHHEMTIENIASKGKEVINFIDNKKMYSLILDWVCKNLNESISVFQNIEQFLDPVKYQRAVSVMKTAFWFLERWDQYIAKKPNLYWKKHSSLSLALIKEAIRDYHFRRLLSYFRKRIKSLGRIDVAGFSLIFFEQALPSFIMAAELKKLNSKVHITFGGPVVSRFANEFKKFSDFFKYVDSFVIKEGELPFEALCHQLQEYGEIIELPINVLSTNKHGKVIGQIGDAPSDFKNGPLADFDDYNLNAYLVPQSVLPIRATCSCYWGKCTFCGHVVPKSSYAVKPVHHIVNAIQYYKKRYGVKHYYFVDDSILPSFLIRFAEYINHKNIDIRYYGDCRSSEYFTEERLNVIRKSGCIALYVGLECASNRIQKLIGKGQTYQSVINFVKRCHKVGIGIKFNVFIGFPTETKEEVFKTFEMIRKYRVDADMLALQRFVLEKDVPIFKNPEKFGIKSITPCVPGAELNLLYRFKPVKGISEKTAQSLVKSFIKKYKFSVCRRPKIMYRDHHTYFLEQAESSWFINYHGPFTNDENYSKKFDRKSKIQLDSDTMVYAIDELKKEYGVYQARTQNLFKVSFDVVEILKFCQTPVIVNELLIKFTGKRINGKNLVEDEIISLIREMLKLGMLRATMNKR